MILINRTFEIVTPESAECGDVAESGFLSQDEPCGFRELVNLLQGGEPSSYPCKGATRDWVTQDQGETERGERESHSIHYSRKNHPRAAKYWRKAFIAAGVAK
jgi:hypothetical protein